MRLIAHRGVTDGNYSGKENTIESIMDCLEKGYEVEVDVISDTTKSQYPEGYLFLGHDEPQEHLFNLFSKIGSKRLASKIWYHCKDSVALDYFKRSELDHYFWHDKDKFTITSKGFFWTADPCACYPSGTIIVAKDIDESKRQLNTNCAGICSPFVDDLNA